MFCFLLMVPDCFLLTTYYQNKWKNHKAFFVSSDIQIVVLLHHVKANRNNGLIKLEVSLLKWLFETICGVFKRCTSSYFVWLLIVPCRFFRSILHKKLLCYIHFKHYSSKWAIIANIRWIKENLTTREKVSWSSIPSLWVWPFPTR